MTLKDALQLLDLPVPFTRAGLKKAYTQALKVWHPDRFPAGDELQAKAHEKTRLIVEAFDYLKRALGRDDCYPPVKSAARIDSIPSGGARRATGPWNARPPANRGLFERWLESKTSRDVAELGRAGRRKRSSARSGAAQQMGDAGSRISLLTKGAAVVFVVLILLAILGASRKWEKEAQQRQLSSP